MIHALSVVSAFAVCAISGYLVWTDKYEDGVLGRIALGLMSMSMFVVLLRELNGEGLEVDPVALTLRVGMALFLARHTWRFVIWRKSLKQPLTAADAPRFLRKVQ
jgi:hypothetical protein